MESTTPAVRQERSPCSKNGSRIRPLTPLPIMGVGKERQMKTQRMWNFLFPIVLALLISSSQQPVQAQSFLGAIPLQYPIDATGIAVNPTLNRIYVTVDNAGLDV